MTPLSPVQGLALFAGAALAIVALFLLRQRAPRVVVPSLLPWLHAVPKRMDPRWRRWLALALQLAAAAVLSASLVGAEDTDEGEQVTPIAWVVDGSASMAARSDAVRARVRSEPAAVLLATDRIELLVPPDPSQAQVATGLARLEFGARGADLEGALALADGLGLQGRVLSDQPGADWEIVGPGVRDVAVDALDVTTSPGLPPELSVSLQVSNHGDQDQLVVVQLETADAVLGQVEVDVAAGSSASTTVTMDPVPGEWLLARAQVDDGFPANDVAYAVLPKAMDARVWLVGEDNRYLEQVLALLPGVQVQRVGRYRDPEGLADLVIFDRVVPERSPDVPAIYLDPPMGAGPCPPLGAAAEPSIVAWDRSHPLLRGVPLRHLRIERLHLLQPTRGTQQLAGAEEGAVILVRDQAPRQLVVGFDVTRTDLPLSVAFPQWVYNWVTWARAQELELPEPAAAVVPIDPGSGAVVQRVDQAVDALTVAPGVSQVQDLAPGVYRVADGDGERLVAVRFPPKEFGRMATGPEIAAPAVTAVVSEPGRPRFVWWVLAGVALLTVEFVVVPR